MTSEITIHYNGASSMTVILDRFFPCKIKDLRILLDTIKIDYADRARHIQTISAFLQDRISYCKEQFKSESDPEVAAKISKLQHKYDKNLEKVTSVSSKWLGGRRVNEKL